MKQMLLAIFSALVFGASAQITITDATFPTAGDTLTYAFDTAPDDDLNLATPPGGNQLWDFTALEALEVNQVIYASANTGLYAIEFPGADLVVINQAGELYYRKTASELSIQGYAGADPTNFGAQVQAQFEPPLIERRSPLNFFDNTTQTSYLNVPFKIPAGLLDSLSLNLPSFLTPDSMRARVDIEQLDLVDGWGTCQIPGGFYDVLRMKRTEHRTTALDVHIINAGWIDIETLLEAVGVSGGPLAEMIGTDTTISYHFYNNLEKEDIVVATLSNDQSTVEQVRFKYNEPVTPSAVGELDSPGAASIQAYPNPAVEWVRFDCVNLPPGEYTLKIFNIIGKVVWKENYKLTGSKSIRLELDDFKKGTYLYSLVDTEGNIIGTKRLVILKP